MRFILERLRFDALLVLLKNKDKSGKGLVSSISRLPLAYPGFDSRVYQQLVAKNST